MLSEYEYLKQKIQSLELQIAQLPEGKLICARNGKYYQWIHMIQNRKIYLPKKMRALAEQLAMKRYLSLLLEDLSKEKKAIHMFLKYYPVVSKSQSLLTQSPEFQKLLNTYISPNNQLSEWASAPYAKNPNHQENLIHTSISGNMVRSKSESMIDSFLFLNKIPYRYECELILGKSIIYPDFTIRHPKTGEIYYWEHFGMMSDHIYAKNAIHKLQLYISHQIIPSIHLITTYETQNTPLSPSMVEAVIAQYFS